MTHSTVMAASETALLVIDVQEKLLPKIQHADRVVANTAFLLDAARILDVAILATEQYPKGLGPTVAPLREKLPQPIPEKTAFSSCGVPNLIENLHRDGKFRVVLAGIETHVCVLHTALDLLAHDFWVYLPVDALGSRYAIDHEMALRRLESAGAVLTTCETTIFEWMRDAKHPRFKEVSKLIQERMKNEP